jgi:hypothetical protein
VTPVGYCSLWVDELFLWVDELFLWVDELLLLLFPNIAKRNKAAKKSPSILPVNDFGFFLQTGHILDVSATGLPQWRQIISARASGEKVKDIAKTSDTILNLSFIIK